MTGSTMGGSNLGYGELPHPGALEDLSLHQASQPDLLEHQDFEATDTLSPLNPNTEQDMETFINAFLKGEASHISSPFTAV